MTIPITARVAVFNGKGGVGKSTVSQVLAVAWSALLIDADPQRSSAEWGQVRGDDRVYRAANPAEAIALLEQLGEAAVIDTPGYLAEGAQQLLTSCSLVVIPTSARENDIRAIGKTAGVLQSLGLGDRTVVVPARVHPRQSTSLLTDLLGPLGLPICPHRLAERAVFDRAQIEGKVAAEIEPDSPAAAESTAVAEWVASHVR